MTTSTISETGKNFGFILLLSVLSISTYIGLKMNINESYKVVCIAAILAMSFFIPYSKARLGWGNVVYMFFAILAIQSTDNPYFQINMGLASIILVMLISNVAITYIRELKNFKNVILVECIIGVVLGCCVVVLSNTIHSSSPISIDNAPSLTRDAGW
jgi:hypothetical protein